VRQNQARGISVQIAAKINRERERSRHVAIAISVTCHFVRPASVGETSAQIAVLEVCQLGLDKD